MWAFGVILSRRSCHFTPKHNYISPAICSHIHTHKLEPLFQKCVEEEVEGIKLLDNMVR